jgi:hypothetical protein
MCVCGVKIKYYESKLLRMFEISISYKCSPFLNNIKYFISGKDLYNLLSPSFEGSYHANG